MSRDVGFELKTYTFNQLLMIGKEVDEQFAKWNKPVIGFLAKYVAAHGKATDNQVDTLKDYEEEKRRAMERTLFLMELVSIPAISWLGATLELRVGAKIFHEYTEDGFKAATDAFAEGPRKYFIKKVHDEFKSKIFGDGAKDLAGTLLKLTGEKFFSDPPPEINARVVSFSPDLDAFGNNLYAEVDRQSTAVNTSINKIAQTVNGKSTLGASIMTQLASKNAGFNRLVPDMQFRIGKQWIDVLLQSNRTAWASAWLYYGRNPPLPDWQKITKELEREIWCIWILQQNLESEKRGWGLFVEDYQVSGASGTVFDSVGGVGAKYRRSPVEARLFDEFNAPLMDYEMDYALLAHTRKWAESQSKKMRDWATSRDFNFLSQTLSGTPRTLKPIGEMW